MDAHTHTPRPDAIINLDPSDGPLPSLAQGLLYSVGIHPWRAADHTPAHIDTLRALAPHPQVRAIGETGLDPLRADIALQEPLLRLHCALAEETAKPLILHIVRAWDRILALKKELKPSVPWVIHGFRGKPALARQLLDAGFYLSYGTRYNPASLAVTPPSRLLRETDTAPLPLPPLSTPASAIFLI